MSRNEIGFFLRGFSLAALTLVLAAARAAPADPLATLDHERASWKSVVFSAVIETPKPGGRSSRFPMRFEFAAPNRYRSEITMGVEGSITTVADGRTIWTRESRSGKIYRQDQALAVERLSTLGPVDPIVALATPAAPFASLYRLESARDSGGALVLDLRPLRPVPNYDRVLLSTSRDARTPLSAETFQNGARVARIVIRDFRRNAPVASDRFRFTPPSNAEVTELR